MGNQPDIDMSTEDELDQAKVELQFLRPCKARSALEAQIIMEVCAGTYDGDKSDYETPNVTAVQNLCRQLTEAEAENEFLHELLSAVEWQRINTMQIGEVRKELNAAGYSDERIDACIAKTKAQVAALLAAQPPRGDGKILLDNARRNADCIAEDPSV